MSLALAIIGTAVVAAPIGFLTCAFLTAGRISELEDRLHRYTVGLTGVVEWKDAIIERALSQVTPGANATVKRIARILKGEA